MLSRLLACVALIASSSAAFQSSGTFSISADPTSQAVWQGGSTSYLLTISGANGFSDVISLTATGLPTGVTASFSPASVTGSGTSTLTINASPGTSSGGYTVTITGNTLSSGSQATNVGVNIVTPPPIQYTYDALGRLVSVTDQNGASAVYSYDPVGNVLSITRQNVNQVNIAAFSPSHGLPGTTVTVLGSGFNPTPAQNVVALNGAAATVATASANQLTIVVPSDSSTGPISVVNSNGSVTSASAFTVDGTAGIPNIASFSPTAAPSGASVLISGTNLGPNPIVMLGASQAAILSATPTAVTAIVPNQSGSGRLSLQTPNGQTSGGDFFFVPAPFTTSSVVMQQRLMSGTLATATFTAANQVALALFEGTAGQHMTLSLDTPAQNQTVTVFNPDGSVLLPATQINSGDGYLQDLPLLSQTGTYEVLVTDDPSWLGSIAIGVSSVTSGDFTISAGPEYYSTSQQQNAFAVYISGDEDVCSTLSASGLPAGVTAHFNGNQGCGLWTAELTLTVQSSVPAGSYPFTVTGKNGSVSHSAVLNLVVAPAPSSWLSKDIDSQNGQTQFSNGVFTLASLNGDANDALHYTYQSLSGDGVIVARVTSAIGSSSDGSSPVTLGGISIRSSLADTAHLITLRLNTSTGAELMWRSSGTTLNFSSPIPNINAPYWLKLVRQGNTFTAFISPDGLTWTQIANSLSISMSTAYIGLVASGQDAVAQVTFDNVSISTTADFSVSANPVNRVIAAGGGTTSYSLNVAALSGFTGSISLSTGTLPAGVSASITPSSITNSGTATLTVSTSSDTPPGMYPIAISATDGTTTHVSSVSVNVGAPDFSLSVDNNTLGGDATSPLTFNVSSTPLNGLQSPVALSVIGLPNGATAAFSPNSISGSDASALTINLAPDTPARTYTLTITGTTGSVSHSLSVSLAVNQADFTAAFTPTILTFAPNGGSGSASLALSALAGFDKTVTLDLAQPTNGINASLDSTSITPNSTANLSATVPPGLTAGTYNLNVTASENSPGTGPLSHTAALPLLVYTSGALPSGWSNTDLGTVAVSGQSGYTSPTFTVQGSGGGFGFTSADAGQFAYTPFLGDGTIIARLTNLQNVFSSPNAGVIVRDTLATGARSFFIGFSDPGNVSLIYRQTTNGGSTADSATAATAPVWLKIVRQANKFTGYLSPDGSTWTKVGNTISVTMAVNVYAGLAVTSANDGNVTTATFDNVSVSSSAPEFSLAASPSSVPVSAGASASSTISVTFSSGYTSAVALGIQGLPSGLSAAFSPTSLTATGTSTLTLTAAGSVASGTYNLNITGASGSLVQSVPLTVTIASGFSLSNSGNTTVVAGNNGTNTITETNSAGFSDSVTFTASGLPSGVSASFTPASLSASGTTTLSFTVSSSAAGGTYPITVTGTSSSLTRTTTFNLIVKNFSLTSSPSSITASRGGAGVTSTITMTTAGGNLTVSFSVLSKPTGVTVSFSPTSRSSTGTTTMTVTASSSASPGNYTLTVKGASGSLSQTTPVTLTVN